MKIQRVTVGPIVGSTTGLTVRLWGRGQFEQTASGPRRCFGVARMWLEGGSPAADAQYFKMNPNFDMTGVTIFDDLKPETDYSYQLGWFFSELELTDLQDGAPFNPDWSAVPVYRLRTAANRRNRERSFVFGSCRYLLRLFGGSWFDSRGDKTFRSIGEQIDQGRATDFLIMMGDQIYADDLNVLRFDETVDEYNARYRDAFSQPHIQALMSRVPTYMTLDDHEIEDGWPAHSSQRDWAIKYPAAIHAYQTYQMSHSPVFEQRGQRIVGTPQRFWYTFENGCAEFFVTDTRTERFLTDDPARSEIISPQQMDALKRWLNDGSGRVKFIASAVPVFPNLKEDNEDKWAGFPTQRSELLDFLWEFEIPRVVFLSGDVHSSLAAELVRQGDTGDYKVTAVISSAFYWPYPHNSQRTFDFASDIRSTQSDNVYEVTNPSDVYATDNFTRITVSRSRLRIEVFGRKGERLGLTTFTF